MIFVWWGAYRCPLLLLNVINTSFQSLLVTSKASTRHFKIYPPLQSLPVSSKSTCHFKVCPPLQSPRHVILNLPVTTTSSISHFKVYPSLQSPPATSKSTRHFSIYPSLQSLSATSVSTHHFKVYPPLQYLPITSVSTHHFKAVCHMKVTDPGRQQRGQDRNSWQRAKHAGLYSDLLQALTGEHLSALSSQHRGPSFLRAQYPIAGGCDRRSMTLCVGRRMDVKFWKRRHAQCPVRKRQFTKTGPKTLSPVFGSKLTSHTLGVLQRPSHSQVTMAKRGEPARPSECDMVQSHMPPSPSSPPQ